MLGFAGLAFARAIQSGVFSPWMNGPMPPSFLGPARMHLAWVIQMLRVVLTLAAAWGLMEHTPWGRVLAIIVAILSLIQFPFGTALGIWTLVMLLGYRNSSFYHQL